MSKLSRESMEKAQRALKKNEGLIDEGIRKEIETCMARSETLAAELKALKDSTREKRFDIEENSRSLGLLVRRAKAGAKSEKGKREA